MEVDCAGDELSPEDWNILEKIKSFLEKLKMTAKALESSFCNTRQRPFGYGFRFGTI